MSDKLTNWLANKLTEKGWSVRELARRTDISHSHAARIVNGEVTPSAEVCTSLAKVFGEPPEAIFRLAGMLPPVSAEDAEIQALLEQWRRLNYEDRVTAYHYLKSLNDSREERERLLRERHSNGLLLPATTKP